MRKGEHHFVLFFLQRLNTNRRDMTQMSWEQEEDTRSRWREPESPLGRVFLFRLRAMWLVWLVAQTGGSVEAGEEPQRQHSEGVDELPGWAAHLCCVLLALLRMYSKN